MNPKVKRAAGRFWREWLRPIVIIVVVCGAFRSALADWNDVPTGSMKPTIMEGDRIFVNKAAYGLRVPFTSWWLAEFSGPERGDVVVFFSPEDGTRYVKRVMGVPGDRIELGPHTDGISVEGSIGPGDSDRIRFDVLTPQGSIRLAAQVDDRPIDPGSVLLGASETRPAAMPIDVPLEDLGTEKRADRPRSRAAGGVRLSLWRIGSSENIIAPGLTEADNERLRSLGYLR